MKKVVFLVVATVLTASSAKAQFEYKPFRVDLGFGYAIASGGGGILFNVEPKYAVIPPLSVGLKIEADLIVRDIVLANEEVEDAKLQAIVSYLATGDYHFTQKTFRPFVGAGFGFYSIAAVDTEGESGGKTNFGGLIRGGFDVNHFRLNLAYNFAGKDGLDNNAGFFSLNACFIIGGGKKR